MIYYYSSYKATIEDSKKFVNHIKLKNAEG